MKDKDARSLAVRAIALEIPVYEISTGGQRTRILEVEEVEE